MPFTATSLPLPTEAQAYCDVSALEGGFLKFPAKFAVMGVPEDEELDVPSLAFLITHTPSGKRIVFDLGINIDEGCKSVAPAFRKILLKGVGVRVEQDVVASLKLGGLVPDDVSHVCISHIHWDHVGDPSIYNAARFITGAGARVLLDNGYPKNETAQFDQFLLPYDRTDFLDPGEPEWQPIGPFARALDYFGDGSFYIVDAPGHLAGNLNALVRTSADGGWIYLAGDSAHDWRLVRGECDIGVVHVPEHGDICWHADREQAREMIRRIGEVGSLPRVRVILAHDKEWYEGNKGGESFWPGKIKSL
jgi:glyoxylase-like metal-dependent hydrolase (beta-lactamase superfamily II)